MEIEKSGLEKMIQRVQRNTLGDILARARAKHPQKLAMAYEDRRLTYAELDDLVNQTANGLLYDGVKKGDFIAIMSKNNLDFVVVNFALARIGAVMVPINYMLSVDEVGYILQHARVCGCIAENEFVTIIEQAAAATGLDLPFKYLINTNKKEAISATWTSLEAVQKKQSGEAITVEIFDDDLAHILYTSGTESKPKGVMLTHKNIISEYVSCIVEGDMHTDDIVIHALPFYHSAQLHCFLGPSIYLGASGIILDAAKPDAMLETIEKEKVTQVFCPPTVWIALLRHPDFEKRDLSSIKKCYYGAAIMPREILKELSGKLPNAAFYNFYGQTEVAPLATTLQPEDQLRKLGSAGKPALNMETIIVDDDGNEVARGEVGEIVHRSPHAMGGYLHDPAKTAEAFRGGWFHSGDLGVMDEEGYITIVDRKKDIINTGGENVSSREVEETIYELDGVSEVAVIGVSNDYWIEAILAVVVPKANSNLTEKAVISFCKEKLAKFKVPKRVVLADDLPKNPSGKVLKRLLREQYQ